MNPPPRIHSIGEKLPIHFSTEMFGAAAAAAPAPPTAEALVAAIPGIRRQENWRELISTYYETELTAPLLEKLLSINAEDATALLDKLTNAKVNAVGSLIDAAARIKENDTEEFYANGPLAALNEDALLLDRIATLRSNVYQGEWLTSRVPRSPSD